MNAAANTCNFRTRQYFFRSNFNLSERRAPKVAFLLQLHMQSSSVAAETEGEQEHPAESWKQGPKRG